MSYYNVISDPLNIGSNITLSSSATDYKVDVQSGNVRADYFVGDASRLTNLSGDGSALTGITLEQVIIAGNTTANTIQFADSSLSFFTDGPAGIGAAPGAGEDFVVGSVLTVDADATEVLTVSGNVTATNVNANYVYGDGSGLTNLTGASAGSYGDSSKVSQVVVDANGRITGISNVNISFQDVTNVNGTTDADLQAASLKTTGAVGVSNTNTLVYDLSVGEGLYVDLDGANVLTVNGNVAATNVNATYFHGDGSNLTGVIADNTFEQVIINGNTTSNVVQFDAADVSLVTAGKVGISNSAPGHTLSIGDTVYVDASGANNIVASANISANYFHGDGSLLTNIASNLHEIATNGNATSESIILEATGISLLASGNVDAVNFMATGLISGDGGLVSNVVHATGSGAGTYGSTSKVPTIAVNASGQITNISETDVQSNVNGGATTNELAFYTSATQVGPISGLNWNASTLTIPGSLTLTNNGTLTVPGDLHVSGNTVISNNVSFEDTIMVVGNNSTSTETIGFIYERPGDFASVGLAYQGGDSNIFTIGYTNDDGSGATIGLDSSNLLPVKIYGTLDVTSDLIVGSASQFIVDESTNRVGIANAAPGHSLSIGTEIYADSSTGDLTARLYNGDGGALSNLSALTSADDVTASSNATVGLAFGDNGRILSIGTEDISLNNVALSDNQISATALNLSNTLALYTSGSVGINNSDPTAYDLAVGSGSEFYIDADASNVVANVIGNVNANYYFGDGTYLQGVSSVDTLSDVVNRGNTTSNVVQFTNATTALVVTQNDATIHFDSNVQLSADGTNTFISAGAVRVADVASNVLAFTSAGEVVQSGIAVDAAKAVSIHDQKLFVSSTKTCTAGQETIVATLDFPASKASLIKVDAFVNDGTNASAHHAEFMAASVSGGAITTTQIVGFGSNNIVGSAGTPVTGVSLDDAAGGILNANVALGSGTNQTVSFTIEASAIAGVTLSSLP